MNPIIEIRAVLEPFVSIDALTELGKFYEHLFSNMMNPDSPLYDIDQILKQATKGFGSLTREIGFKNYSVPREQLKISLHHVKTQICNILLKYKIISNAEVLNDVVAPIIEQICNVHHRFQFKPVFDKMVVSIDRVFDDIKKKIFPVDSSSLDIESDDCFNVHTFNIFRKLDTNELSIVANVWQPFNCIDGLSIKQVYDMIGFDDFDLDNPNIILAFEFDMFNRTAHTFDFFVVKFDKTTGLPNEQDMQKIYSLIN